MMKLTKFNGAQKLVGLLGAVLVAFMFVSSLPATTQKDSKTAVEVQEIDYKTTAIKVLGATFATSVLIVLLGLKPPAPPAKAKGKQTKKKRR